MSASKVARFHLLRPHGAPAPKLWVRRHPSGARIVLADGSESRALASAIAMMLDQITRGVPGDRRPTGPSIAKTSSSTCTCGDCLGCEVAAMRSRKAVPRG